MAQEQKVITPLVESAIRVEPATPPGMALNTRIQRAWAMLFGRRENTLQPVYASRAGMLGTVALDLNGWKLEYAAIPDGNWTDMAKLVDLVIYSGMGAASGAPYMELGMATGMALQVVVPQWYTAFRTNGSIGSIGGGYAHVRCRWYHGVGLFSVSGYVAGYSAPER